jgi:hypothetical protein
VGYHLSTKSDESLSWSKFSHNFPFGEDLVPSAAGGCMFGIKASLRKYIQQLALESLPIRKCEPAYPSYKILAQAHGYARTLETKLPMAADGSPLPWYTYPAIEYCNQLDASGLDIFEYGSGNSSLYWAHKGAKVWCVEHDPAWYESMRIKSAQLSGISLRNNTESYASAIAEVRLAFDIVIIDGVWRNECAAAALAHLGKDGLIILDNSDWYTDVAQFLRSSGYFQVDFNGFGPVNNYCWTTSIFLPLRSPLIERLRQPQPIGGIEVFKGEKW